MNFDIWLTMLVASIVISVSPGAGAVVSMNYGLKYGLKRSYAAIFGLQMGLFIQTFIVVVGLGSLIMNSLMLFNIIKWIGVAYLIFLGAMKFMEKPVLPSEAENIKAFVGAINRAKPSTAKGRYIKNAALSLTMSPAIKFETQELLDIR